jgi:ArsR family transcriptional regulator
MPVYKDNFSARENKMADFMKAMAHPARVAIMIKLAQFNQFVQGEIIQDIPLSKNVVALHLKALERAGLIKGTTSNIRSGYCINWDTFNEFSEMFQIIFHNYGQKVQVQDWQKSRKSTFSWIPLLLLFIQMLTEADELIFS